MRKPTRNKVVTPLNLPGYEARLALLQEAGYNIGHLRGPDVWVDLLTDSDPTALTDAQLAALWQGDEAYAGSRSFSRLHDVLTAMFGHPWVIPAHQGRAAMNLALRFLLKPGMRVAGNAIHPTTRALLTDLGASFADLSLGSGHPHPADLDLVRLEAEPPDLLIVAASSDPWGAVPLASLQRLGAWAARQGIPWVLDMSRGLTNAVPITPEGGSLAETLRAMAGTAPLVVLSGKKVGAGSGGALLVRDRDAYEHLRGLCVIYEGMPTYGGMAGRDMEALARAFEQALPDLPHRMGQLAMLASALVKHGVEAMSVWNPGHALYVALPGPEPECPEATVTAALYAQSGVRAAASRLPGGPLCLRLALPWRAYPTEMLDLAARAVASTLSQREAWPQLHALPSEAPAWATRFEATDWPRMQPLTAESVPYRTRGVERVTLRNETERLRALEEAGYNPYLMASEAVEIDLFTDSGTNAMSDRQWSRMLASDDSYAGSESAARLAAQARETYGLPYVLPTHQGRSAENLLSAALLGDGGVVIGNQGFITTLEHLHRRGGTFEEAVVDAGWDLTSDHAFRGDLDLAKLETALDRHGPKVRLVYPGLTVNASGGQPVSMANLRAVSALTRRYGVPLYLDATRAVENAWLIRQREAGFADRPVAEILRECFDLVDGATISGKKDLLVNIGGLLLTRDAAVYRKAWEVAWREVGHPENGGLAPRDLEAMARGMQEMVDERYLAHRFAQVEQLGQALLRRGVAVMTPFGGHAVLVVADALLPHLGEADYPEIALACELYRRAGVRGMPLRGRFRRDGSLGAVGLVRLTLPRRVYDAEDLDRVAEALGEIAKAPETVRGLVRVEEPRAMRATLSRYRPKTAS